MRDDPRPQTRSEIEDAIADYIEMLEANPTGLLAPAMATEIERLKKLLERFRET